MYIVDISKSEIHDQLQYLGLTQLSAWNGQNQLN